MMDILILPEEYVVEQFFRYGHKAKRNRYNNTYQAGCAICREGESRDRKQRCYYIPKADNIFCHNCGWSSKPLRWIREVSGKSIDEIREEIKNYTYCEGVELVDEAPKRILSGSLPDDSINLDDMRQLEYYDHSTIVHKTLELIKSRRLDTACNRPLHYYLSLTDETHRNRLCIPFYDERGDIVFYQTRTVISSTKFMPKYLSRVGVEKPLCGVDKIDPNADCAYIFEGPLNSFFTKNGVAVAGITEGSQTFTERQQKQYDTTLRFLEKIWVLDSQWLDNASMVKSKFLLEQGHKVFIWPENFGRRYKDFNDIAIALKQDEIRGEFIQKNTAEGISGIVKLAEITRSRS